jgi:hypothetical protein
MWVSTELGILIVIVQYKIQVITCHKLCKEKYKVQVLSCLDIMLLFRYLSCGRWGPYCLPCVSLALSCHALCGAYSRQACLILFYHVLSYLFMSECLRQSRASCHELHTTCSTNVDIGKHCYRTIGMYSCIVPLLHYIQGTRWGRLTYCYHQGKPIVLPFHACYRCCYI